jgi:hypothetical protein
MVENALVENALVDVALVGLRAGMNHLQLEMSYHIRQFKFFGIPDTNLSS